jgi:hypothetical protein
MKKYFNIFNIFLGLLILFCTGCNYNQKSGQELKTDDYSGEIERNYISPTRIVWQSDSVNIYNTSQLLKTGNGQADLFNEHLCKLTNREGIKTSILLDYGKELHGGLQIVTGRWKGNKPLNIRVRFGESVSEAMSELGDEKNAKNDHAIRDWEIKVPWLGKIEIGNTGFRFVRIDLLEQDATLFLKEVNAISVLRDIPYLGSFKSNDKQLNQIWQAGAYTVHLNMQEYLWDGIKRDRLVWVGDMHPEVMTILSVFGNNEIVPKTLDLIKEKTPLPQWMNGISSYSMWWLIIQYQWYLHGGDKEYLLSQSQYIHELLGQLELSIQEKGCENLDGQRFLDWPTSENGDAIHAGLQSLMVLAFDAGSKISEVLKDQEKSAHYKTIGESLRKCSVNPNGSKSAGGLMAMAGLDDPKSINDKLIQVGGVKGFSTFYGYYVLNAMALAENYQGAINSIKEYWGAMLDLGATTFWEDFNIDWIENAARIDEIVPDDKIDIHASYGDYCYVGLRHSLCHGWASGPTAWLSENVLGVKIIEAGCRKVKIEPHLGDLEWVVGTFPTPFGLIELRHEKLPDGTISSTIKAPKEVKIVKE